MCGLIPQTQSYDAYVSGKQITPTDIRTLFLRREVLKSLPHFYAAVKQDNITYFYKAFI